LDRSLPHPSGPGAFRSKWLPHREAIDPAPIPKIAEGGRRGSSQIALWNGRRIPVLVLLIIVLTWLPIFGPQRNATPAKRARGIGDAPILAFAFAPGGEAIATIQMDGRVALRDAAGGGSSTDPIIYPGSTWTLAFSPDGWSLAVGGLEPEILLYDARAGGAGHPLGIPISEVKTLVISHNGRPWQLRVRSTTRSSCGISPLGGSGRGSRATHPARSAWRLLRMANHWPRGAGATQRSSSGIWPRASRDSG
jgi:WD40 repeat protein